MSDAVKSLVLPAAVGGAALSVLCLGLAAFQLLGAPKSAPSARPAVLVAASPASAPSASAPPPVEAAANPAPPPAGPAPAPSPDAGAGGVPPAPSAPYALQLGAFLDRPDAPGVAAGRAKALIAAATGQGFAAKAAPITDSEGRTWLAVRLGAYADEAAAAAAAGDLRQQTGLASTIVGAAAKSDG